MGAKEIQQAAARLAAMAKRPKDARALFAADPRRAENCSLQAAGLFLDASKNGVDSQILTALFNLARAAEVPAQMRAMAAGKKVNFTEKRAAWHTAMRRAAPPPEAQQSMRRARAFAKAARREGVRDIIHLGIGGSHLGPELLQNALASESAKNPRVHFVANVDPEALRAALRGKRPRHTWLIAASKSFGTDETLRNFAAARAWLARGLGEKEAARHTAAVTANPAAAKRAGVKPFQIFPMPEWLGGRFSLWSPVSLSFIISAGEEAFMEFMRGGGEMDAHAIAAPPEKNMPLRLALLGVWHNNFLGAQTHCVVAYAHRLRGLARYLQQLAMESLGKRAGNGVFANSGEVLWGGEGSNDQHSYFQLLLQGTRLAPADFVAAIAPPPRAAAAEKGAHRRLLAHCFGQSRALMAGRGKKEIDAARKSSPSSPPAPHLVVPGNCPVNTILLPAVTPRALGALLSLYEHKTAMQSFIWGVNAFDQWGVELGKRLMQEVAPALEGDAPPAAADSSTRMLLQIARKGLPR